jgi:hypothetical protein
MAQIVPENYNNLNPCPMHQKQVPTESRPVSPNHARKYEPKLPCLVMVWGFWKDFPKLCEYYLLDLVSIRAMVPLTSRLLVVRHPHQWKKAAFEGRPGRAIRRTEHLCNIIVFATGERKNKFSHMMFEFVGANVDAGRLAPQYMVIHKYSRV